jgi:acyl-CoA hydrolase
VEDYDLREIVQAVGADQTIVGSASEAAGLVSEGDRLVISGCGAAPIEFLSSLASRSDLHRVDLSHATAWGDLPHLRARDRATHLNFEAYFLPALARSLHRSGEVDYIPLTFSQMGAMYEQGTLQADVVAVTCSVPDAQGYCSLGPFVNYLPGAIKRCRVLIGECSDRWPETYGASRIHASKFTCLVPTSREPIVAPEVPEQAEAAAIAGHVAALVPHEATIQIGRGAIPNAIASALKNHRNLGIHSEMLSDWIIELCESGAVTGAKKDTFPGKIVTSFMDGSERLHAFAHKNRSLLMQAIYEVNDPSAIERESGFIAINSAVEVDLSGQINAESAQGNLLSGSGGLLDFALGAGRSTGGRFIVALPSTAQKGNVSRIVHQLGPGAAVTVPRTLAQLIVTEHGVADLRGCSLRERARRLTAIADPKFRDHLTYQSRQFVRTL